MVAMKEKRALFGGALRCAGLAATAAMTSGAVADFSPFAGPGGAPNYTFNYTVDAAGGTPTFAYNLNYVGGFPLDTITINGDVGLYSYANAGAIGAGAFAYTSGTYVAIGAVVQQYFTVDVNKGATLYWDLVNSSQYAFVYMYQFGVGAIVDEIAGSSGVMNLTLTAGEMYALIVRASISNPTAGDSVYGVLVWQVPAPGAIALLGLGMVGTRRRRRE
jgi:hypothetical protein